ncbi:unnamed protein product [Heligmosomoides polygyrus]|uniref:Uncharacterized protein n=1 Tax=Heligmosomoides polygyrus TaxID=6339 RepID=A0A183FCI1_HELPZ|nr:unnamed protein product [Heligmosomoides polygyrus]
MTCTFNPADVLLHGPRAMPAEVRAGKGKPSQKSKTESSDREAHSESSLLSYFLRVPTELLLYSDDTSDYGDEKAASESGDVYESSAIEQEADAETAFSEHFRKYFSKFLLN